MIRRGLDVVGLDIGTHLLEVFEEGRKVLGPDRDVELAIAAVGLGRTLHDSKTGIVVGCPLELEGVFFVTHGIKGPGLEGLPRRYAADRSRLRIAGGGGHDLAPVKRQGENVICSGFVIQNITRSNKLVTNIFSNLDFIMRAVG